MSRIYKEYFYIINHLYHQCNKMCSVDNNSQIHKKLNSQSHRMSSPASDCTHDVNGADKAKEK